MNCFKLLLPHSMSVSYAQSGEGNSSLTYVMTLWVFETLAFQMSAFTTILLSLSSAVRYYHHKNWLLLPESPIVFSTLTLVLLNAELSRYFAPTLLHHLLCYRLTKQQKCMTVLLRSFSARSSKFKQNCLKSYLRRLVRQWLYCRKLPHTSLRTKVHQII